jgi:hypothetical protein
VKRVVLWNTTRHPDGTITAFRNEDAIEQAHAQSIPTLVLRIPGVEIAECNQPAAERPHNPRQYNGNGTPGIHPDR